MRLLAYMTCCLLWGSTWLFVKLGLRDLPPFLFAASRMGIAGILLTPFAIAQCPGAHGRRTWLSIAGLGAVQIAIPYAMIFSAQRFVPSGWAAVLFATFPIWLAIVARLLLKERITLLKLSAIACGASGVLFVELPQIGRISGADGLSFGAGLIIGAAAIIAVANVLIRRYLSDVQPTLMTWGQTLSSALILAALAAAFERDAPETWSLLAIGSLMYLAIFGTVITYLALYWLLPRVPILAIGAIPLLDTTFAVLLGTIVLDEPIDWHFAIGGTLVLAGAGLANLAGESRPS
jgi:drug/metabolite transporter (DMT)-like permease